MTSTLNKISVFFFLNRCFIKIVNLVSIIITGRACLKKKKIDDSLGGPEVLTAEVPDADCGFAFGASSQTARDLWCRAPVRISLFLAPEAESVETSPVPDTTRSNQEQCFQPWSSEFGGGTRR